MKIHNSCGTGILPVQDWLFRRCLVLRVNFGRMFRLPKLLFETQEKAIAP
ncbi:MAG: hypothetical protein QQW96_15305 [Tychonema bourrellyi B0820]|nr:hypothetical protein [Tychonema bourrellyi]MDQ2099000.1 hypothetical protein [Tychonema bourrellyi B0820]